MTFSGQGWRAAVWGIVAFAGLCAAGQEKATTGKEKATAGQETATAGQQKAAAATAAARDYASEPLVIERTESVFRMKADGSGERVATVAVRVQSESMLKQLGVVSLAFAGNSEKLEFTYVRVRHKDGTVVETPVTEAIEMPTEVTREAPFYSDLKQKQVPVRSLRLGDTLEWQARITQVKSEAAGQFWGAESFVRDAVVLDQRVELRVPTGIYVNVWSPEFKPEQTTEGEETVYRWKHTALQPTVGPEADAAKEARKKHVLTAAEELDEEQGKLPDLAWTSFRSWAQLGEWYRGLEADRMLPDAEVKAKVAEITAGKTTELEKVQAVYAYVSTQLRYIGVAFGVGRYQPHRAGDVLGNQYGDCKDKHTLLAAMLESLGLKPAAALVGVGVRFNEAVPSPQAFNHMITRVEVEGKPVWLDTTQEVAPYRVLLPGIRDRRVLVVPEAGEARLDRTPAELPFAAFQTMEAKGTLDKDGLAQSRMTLTLRGDTEVLVRAFLRQASPAQYDEAMQRISQSLGFGGTVSHAEVSGLEDTATPLKIGYDYKREKVNDWENYRILPQMAAVALPVPDAKEPPVEQLSLGGVRAETSNSQMKLPEGWGVVLPDAIHAKSAYATLDQTYRFEKGVVYSERKLQVLKDKVPVTEWKEYKKFTEAANLGNEQYIQLVRHDSPARANPIPTDAGSAALGEAAFDAARLVREAYSLIGRHDLDVAEVMLDKAKAANPEQDRLWSTYGYLEFQRGHMNAAIEDYEKELKLNPQNYGVYESLADAYLRLKQTDEGKATLRKWMGLDAQNPTPSARLAALALTEGDAAGAVEAATAGLANAAEDEPKFDGLRVVLGRAQLKAGMTEKGHQTLKAVLERTDSPQIMNDAGYELANAGLELPLAEAKTRVALATMEQESRDWTLDEALPTLLRKSSLMASTWDTLGWVLFREGRMDEAQEYIRAAWLNRQSSEVGEHVAELDLKKGDQNGALTAITLAIPAAAQDDAARLTERASKLRAEGAKTAVDDAALARQKLRFLPLGPAAGLNGTAQYDLLLGADGLEKVKASGNTRMLEGEERVKKAKFEGCEMGSEGIEGFPGEGGDSELPLADLRAGAGAVARRTAASHPHRERGEWGTSRYQGGLREEGRDSRAKWGQAVALRAGWQVLRLRPAYAGLRSG